MAKKPQEKGENSEWVRVNVLWRCAEKGNAIALALASEMPEELWPEGMAAHKFAAGL